LDEKPNLIGFENGVFDLDTDEFRDGQPEDNITLSVGYDYVPTVDYKVRQDIMDFVDSIMEDKKVLQYLLTTLGLSIHGEKVNEQIYFWIGAGGNGKGVLALLLELAMGKLLYPAPMAIYTCKRTSASSAQPEIMEGKSKRIWMATEPEDRDCVIYTGTLKNITGRDAITGRNLYGKTTSFKPQGTPILQMNKKPEIAGTGPDVKRRLRLITFPYNFVENPQMDNEKKLDLSLKGKFEKDIRYRQQFMLIMMNEYKTYRDGGFVLHTPKRVMKDTEEYLDENNHVKRFINEYYVIDQKDEKAMIPVKTLHKDFVYWGKDNNVPKMGLTDFKTFLSSLGLKCAENKCRVVYEGEQCKDKVVVYGLKNKPVECQIEDDLE